MAPMTATTTETATATLFAAEINSINLGWLEEKVAKLNRKAKKLNLSPLVLTIGESTKIFEQRTYQAHTYATPALLFWANAADANFSPVDDEDEFPQPTTKATEFPVMDYVRTNISVSILGDSPKISDWSLVATLDHVSAEDNILRVVPGQEIDVAKYSTHNHHCDHCKTARRRKDTFVMRHTDGSEKVIGRNCLQLFFGGQSVDRILFAAGLESELGLKCFGTMEDREPFLFKSGNLYIGEWLIWVAAAIRVKGWLGSTVARQLSQDRGHTVFSTSAIAADELSIFTRMGARKCSFLPNEADEARATEVLQFVRSGQLVGSSSFVHNLNTLAKCEMVSIKNRGMVAAIFVSVKKEQERLAGIQATQKAPKAVSQYVGEVGSKIAVQAILRSEKDFSNEWGPRTLYRFEDLSGNTLIWWTGENKSDNKDGKLELNREYHLTGTVKTHSEYKNEKQTNLLRCKILTAAPVAKIKKGKK